MDRGDLEGFLTQEVEASLTMVVRPDHARVQ
jgi:hypothetical protein